LPRSTPGGCALSVEARKSSCRASLIESCLETAQSERQTCGFFFREHCQDGQFGAQDSRHLLHEIRRKAVSKFSVQGPTQKTGPIKPDTYISSHPCHTNHADNYFLLFQNNRLRSLVRNLLGPRLVLRRFTFR